MAQSIAVAERLLPKQRRSADWTIKKAASHGPIGRASIELERAVSKVSGTGRRASMDATMRTSNSKNEVILPVNVENKRQQDGKK